MRREGVLDLPIFCGLQKIKPSTTTMDCADSWANLALFIGVYIGWVNLKNSVKPIKKPKNRIDGYCFKKWKIHKQ